MADWDVIIVGAGIAGASAAFELASERRVLVLEREERAGFHATGRSAAVFIEPYGNEVVQALTGASRSFFYEPPTGFCKVPLLADRELYQVATADQEELLRTGFAELSKGLPDLRLVKGAEVEERVSLLRRGRITLALYDAATRDIDVDALLQGFLRGATKRGAEIRFEAGVEAIRRDTAEWKVETREGTVCAPVVVNAAGAWAGRIGERAGATPLGLKPLRRSMFVIDPGAEAGVRSWPLVADVGEQWYFKPESGRLLGSPSEEEESEPCDAGPDELTVAMGVDRLEQVLDIQVRHIDTRWAGLRTFAPDRSPVVGFDPRVEGFVWLAGQGGFGIQTAPAMARLTAALVLGKPFPDDLRRRGLSNETVAPDRFSV